MLIQLIREEQLKFSHSNMQYILANYVLLLVSVMPCLAIETYADVDFYKLYNKPEADPQLSLQQKHTTAQRIAAHGYPVEHHHITTEDGYILGVFRIPYSHKLQNQDEPRPIVLIQHGLFSCSDAWILSGPNDALPYLLADAGYDVWLGNGRGNTYARNHSTRSTHHPHFWRFSWHEIGIYDIAAMIDYVLAQPQQKQQHKQLQQSLHYVGHSQGTTVYFALMSSRPQYNARIKTAHMLAPSVFMGHMEHQLVQKLAPQLGHANTKSRLFANQEFLPQNEFILALLYNTCQPDSLLQPLCLKGVTQHYGAERVNVTALPEVLSTHPAGCSSNQILHYLQEQQSAHFRQFDFGTKQNLRVYGTPEPPDYALHLVDSEVHLWYSDNDKMAAVQDVMQLAKQLSNRVLHHVADPLWDHVDYALNIQLREVINEPVIAIMQQYEAKQR